MEPNLPPIDTNSSQLDKLIAACDSSVELSEDELLWTNTPSVGLEEYLICPPI